MNYWITTHWPPRRGEAPSQNTAVWLPDGREEAGRDVQVRDLVLIYQSRWGRDQLSQSLDGRTTRVPTLRGAQGLIAVGRVTAPVHADPSTQRESYADGTSIWWRWRAPLEILNRSGYVSRPEVCLALGYKPNWTMRGFGDRQSGLKRLSLDQFRTLEAAYRRSTKPDVQSYLKKTERELLRRRQTGESPAHRALKECIAAQASTILEEGLVHIATEYPFITADRADIVLEDGLGRTIGVEVELDVGEDQLEGILQAIKYRRMLEVTMKRELHDSRAFLVAHSIAPGMKALCAKYGVESFEVPRATVAKWSAERATGTDA